MPRWLNLSGPVPLGTFLFTGSVDIAEVAGLAGLDFVVIDREHAPSSWGSTIAIIRAAAAGGCSALIRIEHLDEIEIGHAVDAGAAGIVIPRLSGVEHVRAAVEAARYAPVGNKGACPGSRNASLGLRRREYLSVTQESNQHFLLVGLVEDARGVANLEAILAKEPGLDLVLLGRSDLAADLGHPGDIRHPDVIAAIERYKRVAATSGRCGMVVPAGEDSTSWIDAGMRLIVKGIDIEIIAKTFADAALEHRSLLQRRATGAARA
jgi:2-keto-3-deoxy-L-rhamnonate aldolase RhmA